MDFLYSFSDEEIHQENLTSKSELSEIEMQRFLNSVRDNLQQDKKNLYAYQFEQESRKQQLAKSIETNSIWDRIKYIDRLLTFECPDPDLTILAPLDPSDAFPSDPIRIRIKQEYQKYLSGETLKETSDFASLNKKEEIQIIKMLLQVFSVPRRVIRNLLKSSNNSWLFKACLLCLCCLCSYLVMKFVSSILIPLLQSAFLALKDQLAMGREKFQKQFNADQKKEDQIEESKGFWDKHLGGWSRVIRISRGGSLIPIREANIYEFSALNQDQALLFVSSIPAYIKFEKSMLELEKLIVESQRTQSRRKRLRTKVTEFSSKLRMVPSKLKMVGSKLRMVPSKLKESRVKDVVWKAVKIISIVTLSYLLRRAVLNHRTKILGQPQDFSNYTSLPQVERVMPRVRPKVELTKVSQNKNSVFMEMKDIEMKDSVTTPSRLKSIERVRKKAKLTRLSDLPPLADQDEDLEIESPRMVRPSSLKVRD